MKVSAPAWFCILASIAEAWSQAHGWPSVGLRVLSFESEQFLQVRLHGLRQRVQVIAAFQAADQPAFGVRFGYIQYLLRQRGEVLHVQTQRTDGVFRVSIEARAHKHQLRLDG